MKKISIFVVLAMLVVLTGQSCKQGDGSGIQIVPLDEEMQEQDVMKEDEVMQDSEETDVMEEDAIDETTSEETGDDADTNDSEETNSQEPVADESVQEEPVAAKPSVKSFSMDATNWQFEPSVIRVKKGDIVKLAVTSTEGTHGIAIDAFGVKETLKPNQTVNIEFVADKVGTHTIYCSVFCGAGHSTMKGSVIVE